MSKKVKALLEAEIQKRIGNVSGVAVISPRGIEATKTNQMRRRLREKGLRMLVVRNNLTRRVTGKTRLAGFEPLLEGPSALVFGDASVPAIARLLLEEKKNNEKLELRGVFFEGELYSGEAGVETASKLPTREEAVANLVSAILGPGRKLAASIKGPGGRVGGILKTIEDKAKEKDAAAPAA